MAYDWDTQAVPLKQSIGELTTETLPEDSVPVDAIILVRVMYRDGTMGWAMRWTQGMRDPIDRMGPLIGFSDSDRQEVAERLSGYYEDEEEE